MYGQPHIHVHAHTSTQYLRQSLVQPLSPKNKLYIGVHCAAQRSVLVHARPIHKVEGEGEPQEYQYEEH
jgi:hypothetical protein